MRDPKIILADVGGTFLRICKLNHSGLLNVFQVKANQFGNIHNAIEYYSEKELGGKLEGSTLVISYGRKVDPQGEIGFDFKEGGNRWRFKLVELKARYGLEVCEYVHDAEAMGLAVCSERPTIVFSTVKEGRYPKGYKVSVFAGTGLGHSFTDPKTLEVIDTHGGHFVPCAATHEQEDILLRVKGAHEATRRAAQGPSRRSRTIIFEDLLSGDGLFQIYLAVCNREFSKPVHRDVSEMMESPKDLTVAMASRIYSEFLGLYAHVLCSVCHAYGGVYVSGGHVQRMDNLKLLDWKAFEESLVQEMVEVVDSDLRSVAIYKVKAEHTALFGLEVYCKNRGWL